MVNWIKTIVLLGAIGLLAEPRITPYIPAVFSGWQAQELQAVLIVYESGTNLPPEQAEILVDVELRERLAKANVAFRIVDQNSDLKLDKPIFQRAREAVTKQPALVLITNKKAIVKPLPKNIADVMMEVGAYVK